MERYKDLLHHSLMMNYYNTGVYQGVQELNNGYEEIQFNFNDFHINYIRFDRDDQEVIVYYKNKSKIIPVMGLTEARRVILEEVGHLLEVEV